MGPWQIPIAYRTTSNTDHMQMRWQGSNWLLAVGAENLMDRQRAQK